MSEYPVELIHFNNGLHGWHLNETTYADALEKMLVWIKETYPICKLVFATTTQSVRSEYEHEQIQKRNKKVDTHHIRKYNKHKQNQYIKSYSIFYAIRQENPQIKSLHEAAEKLCNGIFWSNTIVREEISIQFKVFAENVKIQLRYKTDGFVYR